MMAEIAVMTLTDFLLARIADDEAAANRGGRHNDSGVFANDNYGCLLVDPARVLAECEAKQRIIELWRGVEREDSMSMPPPAGHLFAARLSIMDVALRALALPYADHPDYREEWWL